MGICGDKRSETCVEAEAKVTSNRSKHILTITFNINGLQERPTCERGPIPYLVTAWANNRSSRTHMSTFGRFLVLTIGSQFSRLLIEHLDQ